MATLFISDLHLSVERPDIIRLFIDFLQYEASQAEALYILGDLFEIWLGDDAINDDIQPVITGLKTLTSNDVPLYIMVGNRDFLMGDGFAESTGCQMLTDPHMMDLYGTPTLLMHGDTLCTDDIEYQKFRSKVRSSEWQSAFLSQSISQRNEFAKQARNDSIEHTRRKPEEIMDVNSQAVKDTLQQHHARLLIHGHTHRPAVHKLDLNSASASRIVLGDWYEQKSVLAVDESGFELSDHGRHNWH